MIFMHEERPWQQLSSRVVIFALRFVVILLQNAMSPRLRLNITLAFLVLDIYLVIRAFVILGRAYKSLPARSRSRRSAVLAESVVNFCISLLILGLTVYDITVQSAVKREALSAEVSFRGMEQSQSHGFEWSECLALTSDIILVVISISKIIQKRNSA